MRPKKTRFISCDCGPDEKCFIPRCADRSKVQKVTLSLDEQEAMNLTFLKKQDQSRIARSMKLHQSTISRILASALKKTTDAIVNVKMICVEGGCCRISKKNKRRIK